MILGKWPTWRTIFSMYLFIFLTLYMFRTHHAHHQERQIVSIQPLVAVILCRWPCCVQVGSKLLATKYLDFGVLGWYAVYHPSRSQYCRNLPSRTKYLWSIRLFARLMSIRIYVSVFCQSLLQSASGADNRFYSTQVGIRVIPLEEALMQPLMSYNGQ